MTGISESPPVNAGADEFRRVGIMKIELTVKQANAVYDALDIAFDEIPADEWETLRAIAEVMGKIAAERQLAEI